MMQRRGKDEAQAVAANDFLAEQRNRPVIGLKSPPQEFGLGLQQLVSGINPLA